MMRLGLFASAAARCSLVLAFYCKLNGSARTTTGFAQRTVLSTFSDVSSSNTTLVAWATTSAPSGSMLAHTPAPSSLARDTTTSAGLTSKPIAGTFLARGDDRGRPCPVPGI